MAANTKSKSEASVAALERRDSAGLLGKIKKQPGSDGGFSGHSSGTVGSTYSQEDFR